ncbi:MAG: NAD-dependent epimerase/dehydratase family protein [Terriglobales bacterium]
MAQQLRRALVTGGVGFIGTNLSAALLAAGSEVTVLDNFSRPGTRRNLAWLRRQAPPGRLQVIEGDVCHAGTVAAAVAGQQAIFHLAAQVAVTHALRDPRADFEVNLGGTLNVLEAARAGGCRPLLLYTSTNKVYGALPDAVQHPEGVSEQQPLDLHSPYGCSKGAADQYVRDYGRSFGMSTVVFRMSCIYGPHQFGTEDQGWVAHFVLALRAGQTITLYGDGRQVRDLLYVGDLVDAMMGAAALRPQGRVFNVGGGPRNAVSLLELLRLLELRSGLRAELRYAPVRAGDQPYYVSNTQALEQALGWRPRTNVAAGLARLWAWADDITCAPLRTPVPPLLIKQPPVPLAARGDREPRGPVARGRRVSLCEDKVPA